jgi:hypothetical protein
MKDVLYLDEAATEYDRAFAHVSEHFLPFLLRAAHLSPGARARRGHWHWTGRSGGARPGRTEWLSGRHGCFTRDGRTGAYAIKRGRKR